MRIRRFAGPGLLILIIGMLAACTGKALVVSGVDIGKEMGGIFADATDILKGVDGPSSARDALPALDQVVSNVDAVSELASRLSKQERADLAAIVNENLPKLRALIGDVNAIVGVNQVLGPTTATLVSKLAALT